jgi:hypothetical protein
VIHFIWKLRYALHLRRRSPVNYSWGDAWESACCCEDWENSSPISAAEDELIYLAEDAA